MGSSIAVFGNVTVDNSKVEVGAQLVKLLAHYIYYCYCLYTTSQHCVFEG